MIAEHRKHMTGTAFEKGRKMSELILIVIVIVLAANGDFTLVWIIGGMIVLGAVGSLFSKGNGRPVSQGRPRTRIDILHYCDADEHVCTVCGRRFHSGTMTCPHCGVHFSSTKTDDRAFIEEEDEWESWDEEEGL